MKNGNLVALCASLLLLQLELGATSATNDRPSENLYATAREIGLDDVGLEELWRTKQPLLIRNRNDAGQLTLLTYELSPDRTWIRRTKVTEDPVPVPARLEDNSRSKPQEDWEYVPNSVRQQRPATSTQESSFGTGDFNTIFSNGFPRSPLFTNWELPAGVTPRVTTKTEVDSLGRKVTTTTRTASYGGTLAPGSTAFQRLFPDISREPGPINPSVGTAPSTGSIDSRSGFFPRPNERNPVFVPVVDSPTTQRTLVPLPSLTFSNANGANDEIENFLGKVDISTSDIENGNGQVVKTIRDKNGRVLTARFSVSNVKGPEEK
ncbi:uncharacterized protein LOC108049279 [Drosophila rhopaloa]|uniref:Uncharacterized protein n=1 Tax=Drosophila rhopaloa TaxID=1041015 RepID=A0ABM5HVA4_DRORH|nr:uncharacterized protein LOC108049279 [Drosophila rhopaloa]